MALYAGTGTPGKVYRYNSGTDWTLISGDMDGAVLCLCSYNGVLYAGTGRRDSSDGYLYKYMGGTTWEQVGGALDTQVSSLAIHNGNLYIGTGRNVMKIYRLDGDNVVLVYDRTGGYAYGGRSLFSHGGNLYQGDWLYDIIYRDNAIVLDPTVTGIWGSCIWDFAENGGVIYAGGYDGRYYYSSDGISWSNYRGAPFTAGDYPEDNIWAVDSFKGDIYFGCAALYKGTAHTHIWSSPGDKYINILSLLNDGNTMYIGVGGDLGFDIWPTSGYVYSYTGSGSPALISGEFDGGVHCLAFHDAWNIWVKKSDEWIEVPEIWVKKGGVWNPVTEVWTKKGGVWNPV